MSQVKHSLSGDETLKTSKHNMNSELKTIKMSMHFVDKVYTMFIKASSQAFFFF